MHAILSTGTKLCQCSLGNRNGLPQAWCPSRIWLRKSSWESSALPPCGVAPCVTGLPGLEASDVVKRQLGPAPNRGLPKGQSGPGGTRANPRVSSERPAPPGTSHSVPSIRDASGTYCEPGSRPCRTRSKVPSRIRKRQGSCRSGLATVLRRLRSATTARRTSCRFGPCSRVIRPTGLPDPVARLEGHSRGAHPAVVEVTVGH